MFVWTCRMEFLKLDNAVKKLSPKVKKAQSPKKLYNNKFFVKISFLKKIFWTLRKQLRQFCEFFLFYVKTRVHFFEKKTNFFFKIGLAGSS